MSNKKAISWGGISALYAASMLAACGGGGSAAGGSTVTPPVVVAPVVPVSDASTIVNGPVPTSTYAAGSQELGAFNRINTERLYCGFGLVRQNTVLDGAAKAHADFLVVNGYYGHYEEQVFSSGPKMGQPTVGFTAVMPADRMIAAGYATASSLVDFGDESDSLFGGYTWSGFGDQTVRDFLNAPYHMRGLLSSQREVGVSMRNDVLDGTTATGGAHAVSQIVLGIKQPDAHQMPGSTDVQTYPCDGTTGVNRALSGESPSPVPGRDLIANPLGTSVYVSVRQGQTLVITSASMINVADGSTVTLRTPMTAANDPNKYMQAPNDALISADAAMAANTRYQVTINGTNNGVAFSRTFIFTTGA